MSDVEQDPDTYIEIGSRTHYTAGINRGHMEFSVQLKNQRGCYLRDRG